MEIYVHVFLENFSLSISTFLIVNFKWEKDFIYSLKENVLVMLYPLKISKWLCINPTLQNALNKRQGRCPFEVTLGDRCNCWSLAKSFSRFSQRCYPVLGQAKENHSTYKFTSSSRDWSLLISVFLFFYLLKQNIN